MSIIFRTRRCKGALLVSVLAVGLGAAVPAYAMVCSNCATFYQQMFEYAEAVNTSLNTARQLQTQIQQYNNMAMQGMALPGSLHQSVTSDLQRVSDVYSDTRSLGHQVAGLESRFRQQFPGYEAYLRSSGKAAQVAPERYKNWSQQGLDNARTAIQAAGINTSTFAREDALLDNMVHRSQSASGRMQAIQAGNEIAAANVQQLQKLRDLLATQITLQSNYMAQQQERASTDDALRQQRRSGVIINTGPATEY